MGTTQSLDASSPSKPYQYPRDMGPYIPQENTVQYEMWRFMHDFDFGYDMTFEQRFARENCNDRGEVVNHYFANLIKYEMIYYFYLCHQELKESGKLLESTVPEVAGVANKGEADVQAYDQVDLTKREFGLIEAPFPPPPIIGRIWDLWILYSKQYREFCLKFYGGILVKHDNISQESYESYQKVRGKANIQICENLWPEYKTYDNFLFEMESQIIWISMKQKNEFLEFVGEEYQKMKVEEGCESVSITDMTKQICQKYRAMLDEESKAYDSEIPEPEDEIKLKELGEELPETAKPDLKNYIQKKVNQINAMEIPQSVYAHMQSKHLQTEKQSKRYVNEYKKYLLCAISSKIAVTPSEQTDLVWHTHLCTNRIYPIQLAKVMFKKRLGRFDHGPTKGGNAEGIRFEEQYTRTLEIYRYLFGKSPDDIWEPLDRRFNPTLFCMYHVDLRRVCNYKIAIEMTRDRLQLPTINAGSTAETQQKTSIVSLGVTSDSENKFFQHQLQIQKSYANNCNYFGGSYSFGGKCYVQNMFCDQYYTQPHFFQFIEDNTKVGEVHQSVKNGDTQGAKKLVQRMTAEVEDYDRRVQESTIFERLYSAKYAPSKAAACFSYCHFYRRLAPKIV